jgi:hypothetical protein
MTAPSEPPLRGRRDDARQLACDLIVVMPEEFRRAFNVSPIKRAKSRGFERDAAVVLGNVGAADDPDPADVAPSALPRPSGSTH